MSKLEPCPLCRSVRVACYQSIGMYYYCKCKDCGARSEERETPDSAMSVWNRRPVELELSSAVERLKSENELLKRMLNLKEQSK